MKGEIGGVRTRHDEAGACYLLINSAGWPAPFVASFGHGHSNFGIDEERTLQLSIALGPNNSMSSLTCSGMSKHATVARQFGFSLDLIEFLVV